MLGFLKTIVLLGIAAAFAAVGLIIPAHLRSIDHAVLEASGQIGQTGQIGQLAQTINPMDEPAVIDSATDRFGDERNRPNRPESPAIAAVLEESLRSAHVGPARRILAATRPSHPSRPYTQQIKTLIEQRPSLLFSGGPDRTFEDFLKLVRSDTEENTAIKPLLPQLLPRSERASLSGMLSTSSNANVAALLEARKVSGLIRLHPADHAAGAPYDAGILTLALLVEGGHFSPALAQQIGQTAAQAKLGTQSAVRALEDFVIATLSLGRQLDHRSLANLAADAETQADWRQMATLFRAQPDRINTLYAALDFEGAPAPVFDYLATHAETGNPDLDTALAHGPGAVKVLLETALPIYRPPSLVGAALDTLEPHQPPWLVRLSLQSRETALALKFAVLFLAGLVFALAMGAAWRASLRGIDAVSWTSPAIAARNFFIALIATFTLWAFFEPGILKSHDNEIDASPAPRIEFAVADTLQSLKSPVNAMQNINQVTLLVLALFFIVQLVIYCFCLIKLKEIGKQKLSPALKLKLLENEENLFDFGLYVGLGGTVLSLILVAVGIVEASLMAAYASTLFGILFVALLKVLNLRPYRRRLIIEAGTYSDRSETLMKDIEL